MLHPLYWKQNLTDKFIVLLRSSLVFMDYNTRMGGLRPSIINGTGLLNFNFILFFTFFSFSPTRNRKKKTSSWSTVNKKKHKKCL